MRTLSRVLLAPVCGAIAPDIRLLEPGIIHDERIWPAKSLPLKKTSCSNVDGRPQAALDA